MLEAFMWGEQAVTRLHIGIEIEISPCGAVYIEPGFDDIEMYVSDTSRTSMS